MYKLIVRHPSGDAGQICIREEKSDAFIERLGSDICAELKEKYMDYSLERSRCHVTVEKAAVLLEEMITKFREEDN